MDDEGIDNFMVRGVRLGDMAQNGIQILNLYLRHDVLVKERARLLAKLRAQGALTKREWKRLTPMMTTEELVDTQPTSERFRFAALAITAPRHERHHRMDLFLSSPIDPRTGTEASPKGTKPKPYVPGGNIAE